MAAQVARRELDRLAQLELGLGEESRLEQDESEIGPEDLRLRVVGEQPARGRGGLVVVPALELDHRDEVEDVLVLGAQSARLLELGPGVLELPLAHAAPRAVQVDEELALIGGRGLDVPGGRGHGQPSGRAEGRLLVVSTTRFVFASRVQRTGLPSEAGMPRYVSSAGLPKPPPSVDLP